jgi:hypothetical protein
LPTLKKATIWFSSFKKFKIAEKILLLYFSLIQNFSATKRRKIHELQRKKSIKTQKNNKEATLNF